MSIPEIAELIEGLSFQEKLEINERLAYSMRREGVNRASIASRVAGGGSNSKLVTKNKSVSKKSLSKLKREKHRMPQVEIDGTSYWHDPDSNGLWEITGENIETGTGSWIGYLQPGNEEEPIRFTNAFGSERKSRKTRKGRK